MGGTEKGVSSEVFVLDPFQISNTPTEISPLACLTSIPHIPQPSKKSTPPRPLGHAGLVARSVRGASAYSLDGDRVSASHEV